MARIESTDSIGDLFRSERLCYIKADDKDERYVAFQQKLQDNAASYAAVTTSIVRPEGKKNAESSASGFANALLGVVVCLIPEKSDKAEGTSETTELEFVGQLALGWGGIRPTTAQHRTATLGITIAPEHQGKGYGREVINWGVDWAFRHANLHSVSLSVVSFNVKAIKLYESVGFKLDGRLRQNSWYDRHWYDELVYSMIEDEWEVLRGIKKA